MIITIAHEKGGVGKTTTALNLADELKPDVIIDRDTHSILFHLNAVRPTKQQLNVVTTKTDKELVKVLEQSNDGKLVLIDCGGFDSDLNQKAIAASDLLLVPVKDSAPELISLRAFNQTLADISAKIGQPIIGHCVITRSTAQRKNFSDLENFIEPLSHLRLIPAQLSARVDFEAACLQGFGVVNFAATKRSEAAKEVKQLAKKIKEILKELE